MASAPSAAHAAAAAPPAAAAVGLLKKLTDHGHGELLDLVADALLHKHLPSALRLSQACTALRGRLAAVRAAAEARRLRWVEEVTHTNNHAVHCVRRAWSCSSGQPCTPGRVRSAGSVR